MKVTTGIRLKQLMDERNLKQIDILRLSQPFQKKLNISLSKSALSQYVNDIQSPDQHKLTLLAETFKVSEAWLMGYDVPKETDIDFNKISKNNILSIYNKLEEPRQKKVHNYAEKQLDEQENNIVDLFSENSYIVAESESEYYTQRKKHEVKINGLLTAGGGTENFDKFIPIDTEYLGRVPNDYDLAFRVKGDSMYPAFENDEVIFVRNTNDYYNGMFAAVEIDGEAYIKKIYIEDNRIRLVSLNDDVNKKGDRLYPDFYADEKNDIRLIGKVL